MGSVIVSQLSDCSFTVTVTVVVDISVFLRCTYARKMYLHFGTGTIRHNKCVIPKEGTCVFVDNNNKILFQICFCVCNCSDGNGQKKT